MKPNLEMLGGDTTLNDDVRQRAGLPALIGTEDFVLAHYGFSNIAPGIYEARTLSELMEWAKRFPNVVAKLIPQQSINIPDGMGVVSIQIG